MFQALLSRKKGGGRFDPARPDENARALRLLAKKMGYFQAIKISFDFVSLYSAFSRTYFLYLL
jgi:hypothetical protein